MAGRGHCAHCFTPWGCFQEACVCHRDGSAVCRFPGCGIPLYVPPPKPLSFRDVFQLGVAA